MVTSRQGPVSSVDRPSRPIVDRVGGFASYGDDEVCDAEGCTTVLSRYNAARLCAAHDPRHHNR